MAWVFLVLGFIMFISLVLVHEWGHFIMARRNGVEVEEFGLGFPPRAKIITKKNGTVYSINWLPLGGFVKLKGEHDADRSPGSYGRASDKAKTKILTAGVFMNLITAVVLFTIVAAIGMPKLLDNQFTVASDTKIVKQPDNVGVIKIDEVVDGSPASKAGLKVDEQIVSVAGVKIDDPQKLVDTTNANGGKTVDVVVKEGDKETTKSITLAESSPHLGIAPYSAQTGLQIRRSTWSAPIVAVGVTGQFTWATLKGLGAALKGVASIFAGLFSGNKAARQAGQSQASSQVSGPVGIFEVIYQGAKLGFGFILFIIAVISLTLAIMNILPIPALDGGKLFVTLFYRARHKVLTQKTEELIHGTGFAVLMLLFVLITIVDIRRFF